MDEGDDFELEDVVTRNNLNATLGGTTEVTSTKVGLSSAATADKSTRAGSSSSLISFKKST